MQSIILSTLWGLKIAPSAVRITQGLILCTLLILGAAQAKVVTVTAYSNGFNGSLGGTTGLHIDGNHNRIGQHSRVAPQEGGSSLYISLLTARNVFTSPSITVKPNTTYDFSYFAARLNGVAPVPQLQVTINSQTVVSAQNISQGWRQYTGRWNSGSATRATIRVESLKLGKGGNDIGVDNMKLTTQEDQAPPKKTLKVKATDEWLDTGLDIKAGDQLIITAKGKWQVDGKSETIQVTADGYGDPLPGTPFNGSFASLIGRIGNSGEPFLVGSNLNQPTPGAGRLFLQINDVIGTHGDNLGELEVTVEIKRN